MCVQACLSLYLVLVQQILTHNFISESVCVQGCEEEVCVVKNKESEGRVLSCVCAASVCCADGRSGQGGGVTLSWGWSLNSELQSFTQTHTHSVTQSVSHTRGVAHTHRERGRRRQQHIW